MMTSLITNELTENLRGIIAGELNSPLLTTKQFIMKTLDCHFETTSELYNELKSALVYKNELRLAFVVAHYFYCLNNEMYFAKELVQLFSLDTSIITDDTCLENFKGVLSTLSYSGTNEGELVVRMLFECIDVVVLDKDVDKIIKHTYKCFAKSDWVKRNDMLNSLDRMGCYLVKSNFKKQINALKKFISTSASNISSDDVANLHYCIGILYWMRLRKLKKCLKGKKQSEKKKQKLKIKKYIAKMLEELLVAFKSGSHIAGKHIVNLNNRGKVKLSKSQYNDIQKIINWQQRYLNK